MALHHTLLGLLAQRPMTGYEIKQTFSSSIIFFWNAHISQIYRELSRMEEKGWARSQVEPQAGKPDKKVYSLTIAGKQEFLYWLRSMATPAPEIIKSEFLAKIFFAADMEEGQLSYEIKHFLQQKERELAVYRELEQTAGKCAAESCRFGMMTLQRGISCAQADIVWARECLEQLGICTKTAEEEHK